MELWFLSLFVYTQAKSESHDCETCISVSGYIICIITSDPWLFACTPGINNCFSYLDCICSRSQYANDLDRAGGLGPVLHAFTSFKPGIKILTFC